MYERIMSASKASATPCSAASAACSSRASSITSAGADSPITKRSRSRRPLTPPTSISVRTVTTRRGMGASGRRASR
ncbi:hypothetical protein KGD82_04230 [Nocardiopsis eucommiae]|uniref:Uncharacterized protein n=1 Tax=Nocardiopsis eucommiae TaxID=2831970 RepID=A0A975QL21_9ACTN|nr:hypothetical protein KGD82_04230 [Nocardiopsis eucommiae]